MVLKRWDEFTAYFLGYMVGDGSIGVDRDMKTYISKAVINLASTDREVIEIIATRLNRKLSGHWYNTVNGKRNFIYTVDFVDDEILEFLKEEGVDNRKSINGCNLTFEYGDCFNHFVRGLFDSDGSVGVYNNKIRSYVAGHKSYVLRIREIIGYGNLVVGESVYKLCFNSVSDNLKFRDFLYKESTVFLSRKRDIFYSEFNRIGRSRDGEGKAVIWSLYDSLYERKEEILEMRRKGLSFQKLGELFGCHKSQMRKLYLMYFNEN